jgi:two-component system, OmpR family, sensor kinase
VWFVLRRTLRPLNTLRQDILARPALDLTPLPHANLPEELQPFIDAINRLLARLDEAVQNEKRFVADAAHELRTPLAVLASHAEVARQADNPAATREALDKLQQGIARSARLAEQLLDQARLDALHDAQLTETVALDRVIHVMAREFESEARAKQLQLKLDVAPCRIRGDVDALGVLVGNLLDNAIRHGHVGGRIEVRCHPAPLGGVTLSVADNGPGVPSDEHEKIFDRFYRVPGNRERGSGIGLSLVARVAALHGATRLCGSGLDGRGFQVTITFPALAAPQPSLET